MTTEQERIDKLLDVNGELCAEINEKDRRIRELEGYLSDAVGCLDEIFSDDNYRIVREMVEYTRGELGLEVG